MFASRIVPVALVAALALSAQGLARAEDLARGRELFDPCRSCHAREAGKTGMAGPNLAGLKGRRVAGDSDYDYSPALRAAAASGAVWTEALLAEFLADPEEMFPGLWMGGRGLRREADRKALAAYLMQDVP